MSSREKTQQQAMFTQAYHDYAKGMSVYSFFKIHNHVKSEEMVQDTFIKTWGYLVKEGKIDSMKAFLYHILNQTIIDEYRKRKTVSLDVLIDQGYSVGTDDSSHLFDIYDGKLAVLLISRLPAKYKNVMHMRYVQGLSLKEISLITGQSKSTVAVQAHRGLEKLKMLYKDQVKVPVSPRKANDR